MKLPPRRIADHPWAYSADRPWAYGSIRLKPIGLRECVARVVLFTPSEVERLAKGWPSLLREVACWRRDASDEQWAELQLLVHAHA